MDVVEPSASAAAIVLFSSPEVLLRKVERAAPTEARRLVGVLQHRLLEVFGGVRGPAEVVAAVEGRGGIAAKLGASGRRVVQVGQRGRTFGARLERAVSAATGLGYGRLVVVGDDSPGLQPSDVDTALASDAVVLGPSADGGVYLIGLDAASVGLLEGIPWQTSGVFEALVAAAERAGLAVVVLPERVDVDDAVSLRAVASLVATVAARWRAVAGGAWLDPAQALACAEVIAAQARAMSIEVRGPPAVPCS